MTLASAYVLCHLSAMWLQLQMMEITVVNAWRQGTNATVYLGQWERTRLGGICDVEIRYQVSGMSEFGCKDSFGFIFSIFIP